MDELERVVVAAPCPISWETMPGNERVRYCSSCSKNVYNISDMSSKEAEQFLQENGSSQCIRLFRRQDGKVMTDNCPIGLRAIRNKCRMAMKVLAGFAASFLAFVPMSKSQECSAQQAEPLGGEPMIDSTKTTGKSKTNAPDLSKPGQANPIPASAGLIALPPSNNTKPNAKHVMVGGDVCGAGQQTKNNNKPDPGNFVMGKMKAPVHASTPAPGGEDHAKFERDSKAYNMYLEAKNNESLGNLLVAQIQYKNAIELAKKQEKSDPKFLTMLENALAELRKKIAGAH